MRAVATALVLFPAAAMIHATEAHAGGCQAPVAIVNSRIGSPDAGGFDLTGTPFEGKGVPGPEIRFWAFGQFDKASSGTQDQFAKDQTWLLNAAQDAKMKDVAPNVFGLYQANWVGPNLTGCGFDLPEKRTVVEISFPDATREGKTEHRGFYAVASVAYNEVVSSFDFDDIRGASGKVGNVVPVLPIPVPKVKGVSAGPKGFTIVNLELDPAVSYSEKGKDAPMALVAGYRILYAEGEAPTSSDPAKYQRARLASNPALEAGMLKAGAGAVAVPAGKDVYLVAQPVYHDPSGVAARATSAHVSTSGAPTVAAPAATGGRKRSAERER